MEDLAGVFVDAPTKVENRLWDNWHQNENKHIATRMQCCSRPQNQAPAQSEAGRAEIGPSADASRRDVHGLRLQLRYERGRARRRLRKVEVVRVLLKEAMANFWPVS